MKITYGGLPEIDLPGLDAETIPTAESLFAPVLASYLGPQARQAVGIVGAGCGLAVIICWFRGANAIVIEPLAEARHRLEKVKAANRPRGRGTLDTNADASNLQRNQLDLLLYLGTEDFGLDWVIELGKKSLRKQGRLLLFVPSKREREKTEKLLEEGWMGVKVLESQGWGHNGDCRYIIEACHLETT